MRVLSLYQAIRLSFKLWKLDLTHVESFSAFIERFHDGNFSNSHWTERQIHEAYDMWRRDILKKEVIAEFKRVHLRQMLAEYFRDWPRAIDIATMILLALAVLFPPYYLAAGDQVIGMGFAFAFDRNVGRIDAFYLMCELAGILALSWFAHRVVQIEPVAEPENEKLGS